MRKPFIAFIPKTAIGRAARSKVAQTFLSVPCFSQPLVTDKNVCATLFPIAIFRFIALFSAICASFFIAPMFAGTETFKSDVTSFIEGKMKESGDIGLTFAFVDMDKGLVWTEGFGYADAKNKSKVTDKTIFRIASISKTFTIMALMQLCEAGKINMDDPVIKYVPSFAIKPHPARGGRAGGITLDMLAKHRSGILGDSMPGGRTTGGYNKNFLNNLPDILNTMYLGDAPPSKFMGYSNAGVTLLGYIVASVAEPDMNRFDGFVKYTEENIFNKMNMDMTSFVIKDNMRPYFSKGYDKDGNEISQNLAINGLPAGSVRSNAQDMAKYIQTLLDKGKNVLNPETLEAMLAPDDKYKSLDFSQNNIGEVWMSQYPFGVEYPIRTHNGASPPFYSVVMIMPGQKMGVFVSVNTGSGRGLPGEIAKYALKKNLEGKLGKSMDAPKRPSQSTAEKISKSELMKYVGFYVDTDSSREILMGEDGRLRLRLADTNMRTKELPLTHQNDGTFVAGNGRRLAFTGTGKDMVMYNVQAGEKRSPAVKVEKPSVPAYFDSWRGVWRAQTAVEDQDDEDEGAPEGAQMLVFGVREGVPYCGMHPVKFIDKNTCYWETYGRSGGLVITKQPDGTLMSRGTVYKKMRQ